MSGLAKNVYHPELPPQRGGLTEGKASEVDFIWPIADLPTGPCFPFRAMFLNLTMNLFKTTLLAGAVALGISLSAHAGPKVVIHTSLGDIKLELNEEKAPKSVANFLSYVNDGYYDNTVFHRVKHEFMIQGGGFELQDDGKKVKKETKEPIENESKNGLSNKRGTIAMARTMDPHSATAQFFINVKDNDFLNHSGKNMQGWGYAVFGRVVEGDEVVSKIRGVQTGNHAGHQDVPVDPVVIESVTVLAE